MFGFAQNISLPTILKYQTQNKAQKKWVENKVSVEHLENSVSSSQWLTELSSSLERQFDIVERVNNSPDNFVTSLQWTNTFRQSTPYGLRFNLEYYRELDDPTFRNGFQPERLRGALEFSLLKDFLGKSSKGIKDNQVQSRYIFETKVRTDLCLDIAQKYIDVVKNQETLELTSKSLGESARVLKKLSKAVKRGALNKSAKNSMTMDVNSLRSEKAVLNKDVQKSIFDLEEASGMSFDQVSFEKLHAPYYKVSKNKNRLTSQILEQEIATIKARIANLKLTNNQDVFLYGGYESRNYTQNNINFDSETDFSFLGIQAELKFGDASYKNEKARLIAQLKIKEQELHRNQKMANKKGKSFLVSLASLKQAYVDLVKILPHSERLDQRAQRNFYNGKTKYFEFLSSRNQVSTFKRSIIDTKANFWKVYLDYLYLNGNVDELCSTGGGL